MAVAVGVPGNAHDAGAPLHVGEVLEHVDAALFQHARDQIRIELEAGDGADLEDRALLARQLLEGPRPLP